MLLSEFLENLESRPKVTQLWVIDSGATIKFRSRRNLFFIREMKSSEETSSTKSRNVPKIHTRVNSLDVRYLFARLISEKDKKFSLFTISQSFSAIFQNGGNPSLAVGTFRRALRKRTENPLDPNSRKFTRNF